MATMRITRLKPTGLVHTETADIQTFFIKMKQAHKQLCGTVRQRTKREFLRVPFVTACQFVDRHKLLEDSAKSDWHLLRTGL